MPTHLVPGVPSTNWQLEALVGNAVGSSVEALVVNAVGASVGALVGVGVGALVGNVHSLSTSTSGMIIIEKVDEHESICLV
jgi:hypothetical protein